MTRTHRIGAIVFNVADIARTETFYRDTLGIALVRQPGGDDESGGSDWLMSEAEAPMPNLIFFKGTVERGNSPIPVFALDEGGIEALVDGLSAKGVTIVTPVSHAPDGGLTADFEDPDGHILSFYQPPGAPR